MVHLCVLLIWFGQGEWAGKENEVLEARLEPELYATTRLPETQAEAFQEKEHCTSAPSSAHQAAPTHVPVSADVPVVGTRTGMSPVLSQTLR